MKQKAKISSGMVEKLTPMGRVADFIITAIVVFLAVICIIPMWHVLMSSISDGFSLLSHKGLVLLPVGEATLDGYKLVFQDSSVISGYLNTLIYVIFTTGVGFVLNVLGGYCLSRKTKLNGAMSLFILFTMMFSGGMIPTYMVMKALGLVGSRWAIILQEATMAMYVIIGRNAFRSVPESTIEAARLDGCGDLRLMFQIMLPQCKGMFFVTILFTVVSSWNSWITASIYVAGDRSKWPLQLVINEIKSSNANILNMANPNYSRYLIQFAVIVVATVPLLIFLGIFHKQVEKGVTLGAVKE